MKAGIIVGIICMGVAVLGQQTVTLNLDNKYQLVAGSGAKFDVNCINLAEEGRSGKCLRVQYTYPKDPKRFMPLISAKMKIESSSDSIVMSGWFKGKGTVRFQILCRNKAGKYFYPPKVISKSLTVSSPDKWQRYEFTYVPKSCKYKKLDYITNIDSIIPAIMIASGSDVYIDDVEIKIVPPTNK